MFEDDKGEKIIRVLQLYAKLADGYIVNKSEEAQHFGVNERSIQRDIDDIRNFLDVDAERTGMENTVIYDREQKGYRLEALYHMRLTNSEVLALCKILLDSRAFTRNEMVGMLDKLITCCVPKKNQKLVKDLITNEEFHYIEPQHKSEFIDKMWDIGQAVRNNQYIEIKYQGMKGSTVKTRKVKPVAIMFSEFYFYLAAFIDDKKVRENFSVLDDAFPTIYRIDRIQGLKVLDEHFYIPYKDRFEEGEFRKRIQFMYGGKLRKVMHLFRGLFNGTTKVNNNIVSPEGSKKKVDSKKIEDAIAFWETALKIEEKLNVRFNPKAECPEEDIRFFTELQTCLIDGKAIVWRHPFDHFHVGGFHPAQEGVSFEDFIGKDAIRYEFLEGPIPATLLGAEFDLYSRTEMQDFIITNIEWDDEKKERAEVYISDVPDKQWRLTRLYMTEADMEEFREKHLSDVHKQVPNS